MGSVRVVEMACPGWDAGWDGCPGPVPGQPRSPHIEILFLVSAQSDQKSGWAIFRSVLVRSQEMA